MKRIRVLLADDHAVLRAGLRMLIDAQPDMKVVAEAADGLEAVRKTEDARPDVAIVDIAMPELGGIDAIERIRKLQPGVRVLVLTMHDDPAYARAALARGAAGHVVKDVGGPELLAAIRAVHRGRTVVHVRREAAGVAAARPPGEGEPPSALLEPLSARERQVLMLLAQGHTNREAAAQLALSVKTVETYRARLGEKLGVRTRAEMFRLAVKARILPPPASDAPGRPGGAWGFP